jgi:hypothetical protein
MKTQKAYTLLAMFALHLIGNKAFAQEKPDTIPLLKNEIGVNVIPYAFLMANSGNSDQALLAHVFYKRRLKEHLYARLSLALNNGSVNDNFNTLSTINIQSNTNAYLQSNSYEGSNYLQYMAGLEGRWGRKNIKQFAGMDLSYAHYRSETQSNYRTLVSPSGIISDSTISNYKHTTNTIGAHPFYGLVLGFSKHFFITAQVGLNLQFTSRSSEKIIDNRNLLYAQGNITTFDFNMSGVSNHISVCYRF